MALSRLDGLAGVALDYAILFGTGLRCVLVALAAAAFLWWDLDRREKGTVFTVAS